MNEKLKEKITESLSSVLPITAIVLAISILLVPLSLGTIAMFLVGALMVIVGMGVFQLGAEMAMTPLGEGIGTQIAKSKRLIMVILIAFLKGTVITIAEPDLQVLANQVPSIPNNVLIIAIALGVGVFFTAAVLRILFKIKVSTILMIFYLLLFAVSAFTPNNFLAVAFDAGGVTTVPITVPFIMAMGLGLAAVRSDDSAFRSSKISGIQIATKEHAEHDIVK